MQTDEYGCEPADIRLIRQKSVLNKAEIISKAVLDRVLFFLGEPNPESIAGIGLYVQLQVLVFQLLSEDWW